MADRWLQLGDRLILDDADHAVVEVVIGRTDRVNLQAVRVAPDLGGEDHWLLQVEGEDLLMGEETDGDALGDPSFERQWTSEARTERAATGESTQFGRGECDLYHAEAGGVAFRVSDGREASAFVGRTLEPSRIDLRFT